MSTLPPDPYKALGVSPDAQLPEIRSAHRKLVLKCHPDKVQDPTLKAQKQDEFQQVQQAYELLSNEKDRQRYDDQVRLAELREQLRAKAASSSSSRSAGTPTYKYEIRTNDRSYKTTSPSAKVYSYSRSYEDDLRGADIFEGVRTVRRESSYQGKPSKREERERDRERDRELRDRELRERDKERERDSARRKKAEESIRRAEKEAKEARRAEKKQKEKDKDKERKRESEEKKRHAKPYIELHDDEEPAPKPEKKKSSKKHDRDRSAHREEAPASDSVPPPPMPSIPTEKLYEDKESEAMSYIQASRQKNPYRHMQPPAAPTPPPVGSPFAAPDDDARRSSAKPRRGSSGEKAYKKKPSKEVLDDPIEVDVSPSGRPHVQKSATSTGILSGSPPRRDLPRTSTMPSDGYSRPMPSFSRSQTYSGYPDVDPRGRNRSKLQPQIIESDSEDDYERERHRKERKHRSKKHRSPEPRGEHVMQYRVNDGRTTLQNSFSRSADPQMDSYGYYSSHHERPSMPSRDGSYSHSAAYAQYGKYKTSKAYNIGDVQYSDYPSYHEDYAAYPAAA